MYGETINRIKHTEKTDSRISWWQLRLENNWIRLHRGENVPGYRILFEKFGLVLASSYYLIKRSFLLLESGYFRKLIDSSKTCHGLFSR